MKRFLLIVFIVFNSCINPIENKKPNVIIIMTDDQGFGDLGINKNPNIITPNIDQFASESVRFDNFFVSPVCAPTRASLMTGRYSLRTGIRDTYNGGAIMSNNETTIAEIFKEANYATGIFGKWLLGDNYPFRPSEQGFDESLIHLAGGIGQVGDFTNYYKGNTSYFDPILWKTTNKINTRVIALIYLLKMQSSLLKKIKIIPFSVIYHLMLPILLYRFQKSIIICIKI